MKNAPLMCEAFSTQVIEIIGERGGSATLIENQ
jgi:hypothetical protein